MTKLTDTQLVILSSAAQRQDHGVVLPERLKGQAARNTVERLISRGLVEEVRATGELPVWRHDDQGRYALRITGAGLCAIGIEPEVEGTSERRSDCEEPAPERKARKGPCGRSRQERCSAEREQAGPDHWPSLPRRRRNPRRHHRCHRLAAAHGSGRPDGLAPQGVRSDEQQGDGRHSDLLDHHPTRSGEGGSVTLMAARANARPAAGHRSLALDVPTVTADHASVDQQRRGREPSPLDPRRILTEDRPGGGPRPPA